MAGYSSRASTISSGALILASDFNNEYDSIIAAMNATTGHSHDSTAGEGKPIALTSAVSGTLPVANGGTGAASHTDGGVLIGKGTAAFANTGVLADGTIIIGDGATNPTTLAAFSSSTGTLKVANGGTGAATLTANNVLLGNGTSAVQVVAPGTSGNLLTSNGTTWASTTPASGGVTTWAGGSTGLTPAGATSGVVSLAGTLAVANGGTGGTTSTGTGAVVLATNPELVGYTVNTASGVDGEWTTAGLTVYNNGVTPQHDGILHVMSATAGTVTANAAADEMVLEGSGNVGMSILTTAAQSGYIIWGSPTTGDYDNENASIYFDSGSKAFAFGTRITGGVLTFQVGNNSGRGEWDTTGLTCVASGVTAQHDGVLHVMSASAGTVTASADSNEFVIEGSNTNGMSILSGGGVGDYGIISFGTNTSNQQAKVLWSNNLNLMQIGTLKASAALAFLDQSNNEVMRLSGTGCLWVGRTTAFDGVSHGAQHSTATNPVFTVQGNHATTPNGMRVVFGTGSPDNNTQWFIRCGDSTTDRCFIYSDGDLQNHDNSYGAISDARLKQDVVRAGSQWDDVKALGALVSKYRFITDVEANVNAVPQLGLIAQEVLAVSPGLVTTGGDGYYGMQYSILQMKAFKALTENMLRTESLEARMLAAEVRLGALEAA